MDLAALIRDVPDFPVPGVLFKDVTTLLGIRTAFAQRLTPSATTMPIATTSIWSQPSRRVGFCSLPRWPT